VLPKERRTTMAMIPEGWTENDSIIRVIIYLTDYRFPAEVTGKVGETAF